ncbi:SRPBCC family protein [Streptomyces sp. NPDC057702]|uniref:SRPBCC family protein n=1 Tax=unclassified Streptomyces TaxID=2593676 RepID=UPI0036D0CE78
MEHEVFVPVPVDVVRRALVEPARIARCLPGLRREADAGSDTIAGRLRLRIGGSSITYRGVLRVVEREGRVEYAGEGTEARGGTGVTVTLAVAARSTAGGTTLHCAGEVEIAAGEGRLTEFDAATVTTAARRLLDRFGEELTTDLAAEPSPEPRPAPGDLTTDDPASGGAVPDAAEGVPGAGDPATREAAATSDTSEAVADRAPDAGAPTADAAPAPDATPTPGSDETSAAATSGAGATGDADTAADATADTADQADTGADPREAAAEEAEAAPDGVPASLFETEVPPSSPEPIVLGDEEEAPPAEAAHARRTMIGRSAEEVDHAPPRGRYAPVPAPETASTVATLRWAAPAVAAVLASAVVVGRVLRRRR